MQTRPDDHDDIMLAAARGDEDEVAAILSMDTRVTRATNADGWTALHLAAHYGHARVVETLIANNADVHVRSTNTMANQPIHAAAAGKRSAIVAQLLDAGAEVNGRQVGGFTPLHSSANAGDLATLELLLARGADVNARTDDGRTPLALAELANHGEAATLLRARGGAA